MNTRFKKSVPNYPCTQAEIERAAGHLLYAVTDAHSQFQFQSVRVKEGIDQECMALWAPKIGKITPRTLQFGHLDASTLAQGIYRGFYQTDLAQDTRDNHSSFQLGGKITWGGPDEKVISVISGSACDMNLHLA